MESGNEINNSLLSKEFVEWVSKILVKEFVNIYILEELELTKINLGGGELRLSRPSSHHLFPLEKDFGFLIFQNESDAVFNLLANQVVEKIRSNEYTIPGLCNALLLLDRVNVFDEIQFRNIQAVTHLVGEESHKNLIKELISAINTLRWFPKQRMSSKPRNEDDWRRLFQLASYTEIFGGPLDVLLGLIYEESIEGIQSLQWLDLEPMPLSIFVNANIGHSVIRFSNKDILNYLILRPESTDLIASLMFFWEGSADICSSWLNLEIVSKILSKWQTCGIYYFRHTYGSHQILRNEVFRKLSEELVGDIFSDLLVDEKTSEIIIDTFEWPDDFNALGGWFDNRNNLNRRIELPEHICNKITKKIAALFNGYSNDLTQMVFDQTLLLSKININPAQRISQLGNAFTLDICLASNDATWEIFEKEFKNCLFHIKPLFYGSSRSRYIGLRIVESILLFILSIASQSNVGLELKKGRLQRIYKLVSETILFPYIHLSEELILDISDVNVGSKICQGLWFVDKLLNQINSDVLKKEIAIDILSAWNTNATTKWPWQLQL